jgi:hypothetical protein
MDSSVADQLSSLVDAGPTAPGWLDLRSLEGLCRLSGDVVTVVLPIDHDVELAPHRNEVRWRDVRDLLGEQGAPAIVLDQIGEAVPTAHQEGACLATVGTADGLARLEMWPDGPEEPTAVVASIAWLGPTLAHRQARPPYLLVLVDRAGADLAYVAHDVQRASGSVEPERRVLQKIRGAGWSQRRIQQRAEDSWEQNARKVADEVDRWVTRYRPPLVLLAGDVRARTLLDDHLGDEARKLLVEISGSRADDGAPRANEEELTALLDGLGDARTAALLERLEAEAGVAERSCAGLDAVFAALREHRVDTLLVDLEADWPTAWTSTEDPTLVATDEPALRDLGDQRPVSSDAAQIAVRAAIATGAEVWCVPGGRLPTGVAALLRWAER